MIEQDKSKECPKCKTKLFVGKDKVSYNLDEETHLITYYVLRCPKCFAITKMKFKGWLK